MIRYEYDNWLMTLPQTYVHKCNPDDKDYHLTFTQLVTSFSDESYVYNIICSKCLTKMSKEAYERFGKVLTLLESHR